MTFPSPASRIEPAYDADERRMLAQYLDYQRATVLRKLDGLDDEQLRRAIVPSGLCLLGLVKHLTAVEHGWFVVNFAATGEPHLFEAPDDPDADFHIADDEATGAIVDGYLRACARSREVYADASSLEAMFSHPRRGLVGLRWLMLHMIEETARHNGHADIIRELIDGATGD
jgi:uncharacterized damage-inducible protein DinB